MKKLISFLALSFCALAVNAQATHNMKITFQDGNTVVYGMENVKTVEFVEKEEPSAKETYTINGVEYPMPEAVDLGLPSGTKWASMNIGAKDVNDKGGYYCWGDPTGELTFYSIGWRCDELDGPWNSEFCGGTNPPIDIAGTKLDICNVKLGLKWQTPSLDDFIELLNNCSIHNEGTFFLITGPNGNSIKMIPTGYWVCDWADLDNTGVIPNEPSFHLYTYEPLCFWTSTLVDINDSIYDFMAAYNFPSAIPVKFSDEYQYASQMNAASRNWQIPIRAITK